MIGCYKYINFGQPSLKGRRLTVYDIVTKIYFEADVQMALEDYEIVFKDPVLLSVPLQMKIRT